MAARSEIVSFLDELLDSSSYADYGPNGLQVPGTEQVAKIVSGVSATLELLEAASNCDAQMVLVHHGLFWSSMPSALTPQMAARLKALLVSDLNLVAYHLPLDAHAIVGNNALILRELGFEPAESFAPHKGSEIGWIGNGEIATGDLEARLRDLTGQQPLTFTDGPAIVRRLAVVSGGASGDIAAAVEAGADAFITGEPSEPAMADAREGAINFFAAGHYATETFGIRALGEVVAKRFGIEHEFMDLPNPI